MRPWALGLAAAALAAPGAAHAQDEPLAHHEGVFSLVVENDSLSSGADRNYTSGVRLAYVQPTGDIPSWLSGGEDFIANFTDARPAYWGVSVGQSIFTPENIAANPAPPDEHPYAGYLYAQILLATIQERSDGMFPRFSDVYELEFGMIGPSALGQQAQQGIHDFLGAPDPQGWDSQLHDEFVFALSYERRWSSLRYFADITPGGLEIVVSPSLGATIGTSRTEARAGISAQIGYQILNNFEIGPPRVRPALSGAGYFEHRDLSWSLFAGVQARAVARNVFLDGNTYRDSARVDRIPGVLDGQVGFTLQFGDARLAYTYVLRTDEFETQTAAQDFGALALQLRF